MTNLFSHLNNEETDNGAVITPDGQHRYKLWRTFNPELPKCMFIGINPSTATATFNDKTVIRCINFANSWGYGGFYFGNLFSYRSRNANKVKDLLKEKGLSTGGALGVNCDSYLKEMISKSEIVICAWGTWAWPFLNERVRQVLPMIDKPYCLGKCADGNPRHPLFSKGNLKPVLF